jgi:hypothetical protein
VSKKIKKWYDLHSEPLDANTKRNLEIKKENIANELLESLGRSCVCIRMKEVPPTRGKKKSKRPNQSERLRNLNGPSTRAHRLSALAK